MGCSKKKLIHTLLAVLLSITCIFVAVPNDVISVSGRETKEYSAETILSSWFFPVDLEPINEDQEMESIEVHNVEHTIIDMREFGESIKKIFHKIIVE